MQGKWRFEGQEFPTIQELITNQHQSQEPVTNKSQAILVKAILKEEWELNNDEIKLGEKLGNVRLPSLMHYMFRFTGFLS